MAAAAGQAGTERQVEARGVAIIESLHRIGIVSPDYEPSWAAVPVANQPGAREAFEGLSAILQNALLERSRCTPSSFHHLVSASEEFWPNGNPECLRGLKVDVQGKAGGLFNR